MTIQIYPIHCYTQSGNLKPPVYFYLALLFLARTWVLLVISLVSRNTGDRILTLFYPDKIHFYFGLSSGFAALLLFFLSGRDHDKQLLISKLWQGSYPLLLLSMLADCALQLYYLAINQYQYSLPASLQLVLIIWLLLYGARSRHLKASFVR